jgi:hypothetical protein
MEKILIISGLIAVLFSMMKVVEMKYIVKEWQPLKYLIRNAFVVFLSSVIGLFIFFQMSGTLTDFMNIVTENKSLNLKATQIFTDEPGF